MDSSPEVEVKDFNNYEDIGNESGVEPQQENENEMRETSYFNAAQNTEPDNGEEHKSL